MMPTLPFIHLRLHTQYSLLDGLLDIESLVDSVSKRGMPAVAMTDDMNLFAAIKFYKAALSAGIKPIFGADCWLWDEDLQTRFRFTLLCRNNEGFLQLSELLSESYLQEKRVQDLPVIHSSQLQADKLTGLFALSGGQLGEVAYQLEHNHQAEAELALKRWQGWFKDRFLLEIQRVGRPNEETYLQEIIPLAQQYQIPIVATHDVCFLEAEDFQAHEVRVAIHDGFTLLDPRRPKKYTEQQYLTSPAEMSAKFADFPLALTNTMAVAKACNVTFKLGEACLPEFPIPGSETIAAYFRRVSHEGLVQRLQEMNAISEETKKRYVERLDTEINVILEMGFPGYFLIVADFIQWAKRQHIPVGPGRGSGAGSLVAYALKITDIDPLPYDLLFERFLNPERVSMPDFDVDFCMVGRDRVIEYVAERYGRFSVSQIITYGSMAAKAVVRDVGRVMGQPYGFVDSIAKLIPTDLGITLEKALAQEERLQARYQEEEEVKAIIDMALKLEGTVRNVGKHAGGVVIAPSKLTDFTPIYCEAGSKQLVSQYDKDDVEAAGLVKFDFLGLRNLTIIDNALKIINRLRKQKGEAALDISKINLADEQTFTLLKACKTTAVFQLESRGMKDLIKRLQPDCFEDIVALVALFRPGPLQSGMVDDFINRKHGRAQVEYPHPWTEAILKPTYGIILYQEQVMMLAQVLAGYSLGGADLLRRAMGKKKPEEMAKQRDIFLAGAKQNQISEGTANAIFDLMEKFAGYGFNKSHSAAYALVAYQTAYLKAHYPDAFMAAVLSSDMDNTDKVVGFIDDCLALALAILPPDINHSYFAFTVETPGNIRYGFGAVKGVGESAAEHIVAEREQRGPYKDLYDFCSRLDLRKVNKRVLEALIAAGAMDAFGYSRSSLLAALPQAIQLVEQAQRNADQGQHDLFGAMADSMPSGANLLTYPVVAEDLYQTLLAEKAVLGLFLSAHPMAFYEKELKALKVIPMASATVTKKAEVVRIAGVCLQTRRLKTKKGQVMLITTIDDGSARMEVTLFPDQVQAFGELLKKEEPLIAEVELQPDDFTGGLRARCHQLYTLSQVRTSFCQRLRIHLAGEQAVQIEKLDRFNQLLTTHQGSCPIIFSVSNAHGSIDLRLLPDSGVQPEAEVWSQITKLFGESQVIFEY